MKLKSSLAGIALVTCAMFAANGHAQAPAGSTGECKDGTYSSAASKRGACAAHGGVKDWYGAQKPTASAAAAAPSPTTTPSPSAKSKAATPAASTAPAKPAGMPAAAAPGGGAGQVWVNTSSKVYHCQGDKYYGKTKKGEYMTEAAAKAAGNHADHGKACG